VERRHRQAPGDALHRERRRAELGGLQPAREDPALTDTRIDPSTGTGLGPATDASFNPDGRTLVVSYADG